MFSEETKAEEIARDKADKIVAGILTAFSVTLLGLAILFEPILLALMWVGGVIVASILICLLHRVIYYILCNNR